jgi:peptidyl-prolyl cis-trans isomerase D
MFELFRNRQSAMKYVLGFLLALIALSMVITMIPNWGLDFPGDGGPNEVIAKIDDETITAKDVDFAVQNVSRGRQMPPEILEMYLPQIIDGLITERALYVKAKDMGLNMTAAEQATAIRSVLAGSAAELFSEQGQLKDKALYESYIRNQMGMTVANFEQGIAKQALIVKMQNMVADAVVVPPQELERDFHVKNDKIRLQYISVMAQDVANKVTVSPQEIEDHYRGAKGTYQVPAKRSLEYVVLDAKAMAEQANIPEADLRALYQQRLDSFKEPEQIKSRHILLKTTDLSEADAAKKKAKADELYQKVKNGGDFAALAKEFSEDTGSGVNGGDLGFRGKGELVKEFEETMFRLKKGEISAPVKTQFGYHIIQVMDRTTARTKSFDEVRSNLLQERARTIVSERMQQQADQLRAAFAKGSAEGAAVAKQLGLTVTSATNVGDGDPLPVLGASDEMKIAMAGLKVNDVAPTVTVGTDKMVVLKMTGEVPARTANLDEVLARVSKEAKDAKISRETSAMQVRMQNKLNELKSLGAAATALGLTVKTSEPFNRSDTPAGIGPAYQFNKAFDDKPGTIVGPFNTGEAIIAGVAIEKIPADMKEFAVQKAEILKEAKARKARERGDLLNDSILKQFQEKGRIKKNEDAIKRIQSRFRT